MSTYTFCPISAGDLPMIRRWLAAPHVCRWWGDPDEQLALVRGDIGQPCMTQFIVEIDGRPFGYLQCYDPAAWPEHGLGAIANGARGIDQFIGEPDLINQGHGSAFVRHFVSDLLAARVPRVLTDPDPSNTRAIRAYEKAGFYRHGLVQTPGGCALLMVCDA